MMKQIAAILSIVLILGTTACSSSDKSTIDQPVSSAAEKGKSTTTASAGTTKPTVTSAETKPADTKPTETQPTTGEVSIEKQVLLEQKDVKITATGLERDGLFGATLKVLIENNSDTDLTIQTRNVSINGYMINSLMSADVSAGKKANDEVTFMNSDLEAAGISDIADMEITFHVFKSEGWDEYFDSKPIQLKTSIADTYEYKFDDTGKVLYDKNNIRIIAKGISNDDSIFGPGLILFIENNGKKGFTVQARDVSVNGFMINHTMSTDVSPKKKALTALTFFKDDLEKNDIEKITDVELAFHIFDMEKWDTIADTKKFELSFD